jgi:LytS/YehU family sensor histidine kinase
MPFMPGFDGMTLGLIIAPTAVSLAAAGQGIVARRPGAIVTAIALSVFLASQFIFAQGFLDTTLYIAVGLLALVLFVDQAVELRRSRRAAAEAGRKASLLELELLRRRIAPHFLMNTLNALTEWVESDPKTGVKMIEALAGEFRLLSQIADRTLIPLGDEIALCRRHLEVMSYRTDRAFTLRADDVDERIEIPPGVLHTLVENAFTHGRFADGAEFVLKQEREGESVKLALLAPQAEAPAAPREEGGQGLSYVRARLEAAFGAAASFAGRATPQGWLSEILLPASRRQPA